MRQLSIVSHDEIGAFTKVSEALAKKNINIENIDVKSVAGHVIILLSVDKYEAAIDTLSSFPEFQIITEDVILIRLPNEPGALAKVSRRFTDANINLRSIRFIQRNQEDGLVAISVDRTKMAIRLVSDVIVS